MPAFTITAALTVAHLISSFASLEPLSLKHVSPKRGGATISNLAGMSVGFGDLGRGGGGGGGGRIDRFLEFTSRRTREKTI